MDRNINESAYSLAEHEISLSQHAIVGGLGGEDVHVEIEALQNNRTHQCLSTPILDFKKLSKTTNKIVK